MTGSYYVLDIFWIYFFNISNLYRKIIKTLKYIYFSDKGIRLYFPTKDDFR